MANKLEKVIKGLECCAFSKRGDKCEQCPYFSGCETEYGAFVELAHDALALLKAQNDQIIMLERGLMKLKAQEPVSAQKKHMELVGLQTWDWVCGNCGQTVV